MIPKKPNNSTLAKFLVVLLCAHVAVADPISGDCQNGHGRYDFGFAIYEGDFKDGQPEGLGALEEDGVKTVGEFHNGVLNGHATIYAKDGSVQNAEFKDGQRRAIISQKVAPEEADRIAREIVASGLEVWKNDAACQGDCKNGIGTYKFDSGNVYAGSWKNAKRDGQGTGTFANGDKYIGAWRDNLQNGQGVWTRKDGWQFTGEFRNGDPFDGIYNAPNGGTVEMKAGVVVMPPPAFPNIPAYLNGHFVDLRPQPDTVRCPVCGGDGHLYRVERNSKIVEHTVVFGATATRGGETETFYHESVTYDPVASSCPRCHGTGQIPAQ